MAKQFETLLNRLQDFRSAWDSRSIRLSKDAEAVIGASRKVAEAWSGSFVGYHARLYYGEFETPPPANKFSVQWGGINGIPSGWREREPGEINAEIESLVGETGCVDELEQTVKTLKQAVKDLQADILVGFSALPVDDLMTSEKNLLERIETFKFGTTSNEFISDRVPSQAMTRDMEAIARGIVVPAHVYYECSALEAQSLCEAVGEFQRLASRLTRQLTARHGHREVNSSANALRFFHEHIYEKCHGLYDSGAYAQAVELSFKIVKDRLRNLTGHETGSEAFGKGKLFIDGAAASNVEADFNEGVKFLLMCIDKFRNQMSHTSGAEIPDAQTAREYLSLSSLAMHLLDQARICK